MNSRFFPLGAIHYCFIVAIVFHWFAAINLQFFNKFPTPSASTPAPKLFTVDLNKIPQNKLRTVGKADGQEDFFSAKEKAPKKNTKLALDNLGKIQANLPPQQKVKPSIQMPHQSNSELQKITQTSLKELSMLDQSALRLVDTSQFSVNFKPPKGVSYDQLNNAEMIFYSFQKRIYENYVNSFANAYNNLANRKPQLRNKIPQRSEDLIGQITFDEEGNVVRIQFMSGSQDPLIQELFEETLKNVRSLPNPPKDFIQTENKFQVFYKLSIKS